MEIKKLFKELGIRNNFNSLLELLKEWEEIVEECSIGQTLNKYELDYDLIVRDELETIINSEIYRNFFFDISFIKKLKLIDNKFLTIIKFDSDDDKDVVFWKRKFSLLKDGGSAPSNK